MDFSVDLCIERVSDSCSIIAPIVVLFICVFPAYTYFFKTMTTPMYARVVARDGFQRDNRRTPNILPVLLFSPPSALCPSDRALGSLHVPTSYEISKFEETFGNVLKGYFENI